MPGLCCEHFAALRELGCGDVLGCAAVVGCVVAAAWLYGCAVVRRRVPLVWFCRRFDGRRAGSAVRTRDRHVVNTAPLWGAVVALWVMEVFSARCTPPLDLGVRDHGSLDLVFEPNDDHNI